MIEPPGSSVGWLAGLLDRSILFSFDRAGFERHQRLFDPADSVVDLSGEVCLVTGANSGLGRCAAEALAARRAQVWLVCRNRRRGESAAARIRATTGNDDVHVAQVDVAEGESIQRFVQDSPLERIDVLINNAGVLSPERQETNEGLERTLATNLVGPLRLTEGLIERLGRGSAPRVINVSSGGMYLVRVQLGDPNWQSRRWDGMRAYAETKRALVLLTELWAEQYAGTGIAFHSVHPGWADTSGVRRSLPRFWQRMRRRLRTAEQGADTIVWLAIAHPERLGSGRFWFDRRRVPTHLLPWTRETAAERCRFRQLCDQWRRSDEMRKEVA